MLRQTDAMVHLSLHRLILTGASGGLGRNFLDLIRDNPDFEVLCLLRDGSRAPVETSHIRCQRVDFNDQTALADIFGTFQPTAIVHAAASGMTAPKPSWDDLKAFNVDVSLKLLRAAAAVKDCHFIFIGTGLAYRDQGRKLTEDDALDSLNPYGTTKAAADLLLRSAAADGQIPLTVLRPFSFTGLWDDRTRLFAALLRAAENNEPMLLSPGEQKRDHCSTRDIATGILAAVTAPAPNPADLPRIYNLGSGAMLSLREVIEDVVRQTGLAVDLRFGARPYPPYEPMVLVADSSKAARDLGWRPRHNLAHAVWQLARESFPRLNLTEPREFILG